MVLRFRSPRLGAVVVALVAWVGVSVLSAVQSSLRDGSRSWDGLLAGTLLAWLPWLLFTVPIARLSSAAWDADRRLRQLGAHLAAAAGCSALYLGYLALFRALPRPAALGAWRREYQQVAGEHLLGALLTYCLIAIAAGLWSRRGTRRGESRPRAPGIAVRRRGRTRFVAPESIDWVAAEGSYARLHLGAGSELLRRSLSELATELEPHGFLRVHRSAVVNLERVREVEPAGHGDGTLVLADGTRVRLSRTYRGAFEAAVGGR